MLSLISQILIDIVDFNSSENFKTIFFDTSKNRNKTKMKDLKETLRITKIAEKESNEINNELDIQSEKLVRIQKVSGEGKGLLFINQQLILNAGKGAGVKFIVGIFIFIFIVSIVAYVKIKFF